MDIGCRHDRAFHNGVLTKQPVRVLVITTSRVLGNLVNTEGNKVIIVISSSGALRP